MEINYKRTPVDIHRSPYIDQVWITGMSYKEYKKFCVIIKALDKETIADYILEMVKNNSDLKNIHIQSKIVVQYVFCKILELTVGFCKVNGNLVDISRTRIRDSDDDRENIVKFDNIAFETQDYYFKEDFTDSDTIDTLSKSIVRVYTDSDSTESSFDIRKVLYDLTPLDVDYLKTFETGVYIDGYEFKEFIKNYTNIIWGKNGRDKKY